MAKQAALHRRLQQLQSVIVAYSGGVDSAYLAYAAHTVLGSNALAIIADSASLSRRHLREAIAFAASQSIPLVTIATAELASEDYARNDATRCFHCKDELFTVLERERTARNIEHVVYGLNADDTRDYRPGQQAAAAHAVLAPLADAGLTKEDVRALARAAALDVWDKPASACLSSRIEYGRRVTPEVLAQVEQAEDALAALGLRRFRVRHHGAVARIEIAPEEMDCRPQPRAIPAHRRRRPRRRLPVRRHRLRRLPLRLHERSPAAHCASGEQADLLVLNGC